MERFVALVLSDFQSAEQFTVVFLVYPLMKRICSHVTVVFFFPLTHFFQICFQLFYPKIGPSVIVCDREEE